MLGKHDRKRRLFGASSPREFVTVSDPASACGAHSGFVLRWVLATVGGTHVQMRRPGAAAAAKVPCLAAPGRSRPALDGHDDAAAEAELGADELSVLQQAVTHHGQGRPKLLICVACKVHVVHDDDATLAKRGHRPAQLEDLPAGRVREYQVKLAEPADDLGPVPRLEANPRRPSRRKRPLPYRIVELDRDDLHVLARSQAMDQPGKPDADAGADLQNPATAGYRRGQGGQQFPHFDLAGEPETGSGGSFVRGQNTLGKLLALGHKTILPSTCAPCLAATRPTTIGRCRVAGSRPAAARQAFWSMFGACFPPAAPGAGPAGLLSVAMVWDTDPKSDTRHHAGPPSMTAPAGHRVWSSLRWVSAPDPPIWRPARTPCAVIGVAQIRAFCLSDVASAGRCSRAALSL